MSTQKASKISSQEAPKTSSTVKAAKSSPAKSAKLGSPKSVKTSSGKPPVYRRNRLLAFTQMALIKAGVLVQVYDYKKSKDLPLKGGKVLTTTRGVPVTFYKVGPDIHLESEGRFHLPDIQPEHLERVFKNFTAARVSERHFPPGLEDFLTGKAGLKEGASSPPLKSTEKSEFATFACWLAELKAKGPREAAFTRALIKEKLADQDQEIAWGTSCKVSLVCPLGRTRMVTPVRADTCDHLQCFDAQHYLAMNERKQKWICPVCNKPALRENLQVDGFFSELLSSSRLPAEEQEIVLNSDGTWDPLPAKKECTTSPKRTPSPKRAPSPTRAASPALSCPLCSLPFPMEELEEHAASCTGPQQQDSKVDCPICGLGMEASVLEQHAATCAAAMFGS